MGSHLMNRLRYLTSKLLKCIYKSVNQKEMRGERGLYRFLNREQLQIYQSSHYVWLGKYISIRNWQCSDCVN